MSSPDPLNEAAMAGLASLPPSSITRRVTRSQSSQRLLALGSSPRKQMFELQVGDRRSPQRLLVTVETEGQLPPPPPPEDSVGSNAKRKLFQFPDASSSTPARQLRGRSTTTTVPLRQSIEEQGDDATPKARGLQRKSNGTPMPGVGTKRRATTPVRRTPRRLRTMTSADGEEPSSEDNPEPSVLATPTSRRQNLRPRKTPRKTPAPVAASSEPVVNTTPRASTARRGRRRRQAMAPDELLELADEVGDITLDTTLLPPVTSEDEVDLVKAPSDSTDDGSVDSPASISAAAANAPSSPSPNQPAAAAEPNSDIWIGNMSNEATPRASTRTRRDVIPESSPGLPSATYAQLQPDPDVETSQAGNYSDHGYGELGAAASDRSSVDESLGAEDPAATSAPSGYDTIAHGEDFSMIFMDSIQGLHGDFNSSVHPIVHEELGEETNLIINNTLESLRQEAGHDESDEDDDVVDVIESAEAEAAEEIEPAEVEAPPTELAEPETVEEEVIDRQATPLRQSSSPSGPSPRWSRSPRKTVNSSPLRHRVLKQNAWQTGDPAAVQFMQNSELRSSPTPEHPQQGADRQDEEVSNLYEDSFSEIPEAVLAAATPRRPQAGLIYEELEHDADQVQMVDEDGDEVIDENRQEIDELAQEEEHDMKKAAAHHEQDVQYPELSQHMTRLQENKAEYMDELQEEDVYRIGDEDEAEEIEEDEPNQDDEENLGQDHVQDWEQEGEDEEQEGDDESVPEEESEVFSEPEPPLEPKQTPVLEENDKDELAEEEYEDEEDGADSVEHAELGQVQESADMGDAMDSAQEDEERQESESEEEDIEANVTVSSQHDEEDEEMEGDDGSDNMDVPLEVDAEDEEVEEDAEDAEGPGENMTDDVSEDDELAEEPVAAPSVASTAAHSGPVRLPTPDNTPPQTDLQTSENAAEKSARGSRPPSRLRSSPRSPGLFENGARFTAEQRQESEELEEPEDEEMQYDMQVAEENPEGDLFVQDPRQKETAPIPAIRQSVDATPPHQISSPVHEPLSLQQETLLDKTLRPPLSTIIRAGRVLQSITSDPPSPEGRERQLGSPFRRSGSKDSWSGSKDSQASRRMSRSPLQNPGFVPTATKWDSPSQQQAQGPAARNARHPSFLSSVRRSKEPSVERNRSPSRPSPASSMHITPPSDGALSWVEREGPISPSLRGDNSLREVAGLAVARVEQPATAEDVDATPKQPGAQPPREPNSLAESQPGAEQTTRDDDTDIWELEAQRETPRPARQQPFGKRVAPSNRGRGVIPSPWTKRSVQRPAISRMISQAVPDLSHLTEEPSALPDQTRQSSSPDEYSRLAQSQKEEAAAAAAAQSKSTANGAGSAAKASLFDLSSFFSSPAAFLGMPGQKATQSSNIAARPPMALAEQAPAVVPTSSMFPQIPQKAFRPDSSNRSSLFSPARRRQPSSREPGQEEQSPEEQQQPPAPVERSSSPATPEQQPRMPIIAQKQNFTPRPRQPSTSFFQPSSNPSVVVTPPRMQLSHADIHRWTQQTSNASEASSDFQGPLLRPLPPKNASPNKSSLRSPLKPHTPGRVVEFTSSVLSPAEQVRARTGRRSVLEDFFDPPQLVQDDKENTIDDISMDDAPPLEKTPPPEALSQTTWSRRHWVLLDKLLQYRRSSPFPISYAQRADKYLGMTVKSHGEAMTLDRWHLDVVDAFKAEVGGWDEGVLAKRLFALILGEEKRRHSKKSVARRVMFH